MTTAQRKWFQAADVQAWLRKAWVHYSWRPGYQVLLNDREATAWVNMERKLVVCNPSYPYPPAAHKRHVRHLSADHHQFQISYLESLVAHEAGHTHYSGPLPRGLLGQLVNILEDQRMEWLMAQDFHNLRQLFQLAADADAAHAIAQGGQGGDVIRGCLLHRLTFDHPKWAYQPEGQAAEHWEQVRPIVERSWRAAHYPQVIDAAREILDILGIEEGEEARESLSQFLDGEDQLIQEKPSGTPTPAGSAGQGQANGSDSADSADNVPERPSSSAGSGDEDGEHDQEAAQSSGAGEQGGEEEACDGGADTPEACLEGEEPGEVQPPGSSTGQGASDRPLPPRPDPAPSAGHMVLRELCEGDARKLSHALNPSGKPSQVQSSRDRGRYRFDRDIRGSDRPFDRRVGGERPGQTHLRLAVDISSSMAGKKMEHARRATFTAALAAHKAGIPMIAVAFDHQVYPLVELKRTPTQNLNSVAALSHQGNTFLAPALSAIWSTQLAGQSLTIIITDGQLVATDYQLCARQLAEHRKATRGYVIPVLLGDSPRIQQEYEATFGACIMLRDPADLTGHLTSFIRNMVKQNRR